MLWASFCVGFFGFMRSGEFSVTGNTDRDSIIPLAVSDVSVDSRDDPQIITIHLRRSKTDQYARGEYLYLGRTYDSLCPVSAILAYLAVRPPSPGPLFIFKDGAPLSQRKFISSLREALSQAGINPIGYSGHSLRIGAATTAATLGMSDSLIKSLGRWKSSVFTTYIRNTQHDLATASAHLSMYGWQSSGPGTLHTVIVCTYTLTLPYILFSDIITVHCM